MLNSFRQAVHPDGQSREIARDLTFPRRVLVPHLTALQYTLIVVQLYGVRPVRRPIGTPDGNDIMINCDLTPAKWASGNVTMRFLVDGRKLPPYKVIPVSRPVRDFF